MNKNKKVILLAQGAMIAAAYAAATWLSAVFGIAYGAVQFRLSEALAVLSVLMRFWAIYSVMVWPISFLNSVDR